MSKAFTKETDSEEEEPEVSDTLPKHLKNYMTPGGFAALKEELRKLLREERPKVVEIVSWAAGNGDRSENGDYIYGKKRLREIDKRIRYLTKRIESAEVVDPKLQQGLEQVFFGATVSYMDEEDTEHTVQLVGIDEADLDKGKISWISPVAKALLKARIGDVVEVKSPTGIRRLEITAIRYLIT